MSHHDMLRRRPRPSMTNAITVTSEVYQNNVQQLRCQYGHATSQEARPHGPPPLIFIKALLWIPLLFTKTTQSLFCPVINQRRNNNANLTYSISPTNNSLITPCDINDRTIMPSWIAAYPLQAIHVINVTGKNKRGATNNYVLPFPVFYTLTVTNIWAKLTISHIS